jgi:AraC-like DNA-binding protein
MSDVLTEVLNMLRISTTLYALAELTGEWGVAFPDSELAYFHLITGGAAWLTVEGAGATPLGPGDAVLLARGSAHRITAGQGGTVRADFDPNTWMANRRAAATSGAREAWPEDQPAVTLVCGAVRLESPRSNPLTDVLPAVLHLPAGNSRREDLEGTLAMIEREGAAGGPGSEVLLARLGDVLLVQVIRGWLARQQPGEGGWLTALRDPQIGAAIAAIHDDPGQPWTVASLARAANLSRSRFSERFGQLVGEPPVTYLQRWRMTQAAHMLRAGQASVAEISRAVGYRSEPAFRRAFTRSHGAPPRRFASRL